MKLRTISETKSLVVVGKDPNGRSIYEYPWSEPRDQCHKCHKRFRLGDKYLRILDKKPAKGYRTKQLRMYHLECPAIKHRQPEPIPIGQTPEQKAATDQKQREYTAEYKKYQEQQLQDALVQQQAIAPGRIAPFPKAIQHKLLYTAGGGKASAVKRGSRGGRVFRTGRVTS